MQGQLEKDVWHVTTILACFVLTFLLKYNAPIAQFILKGLPLQDWYNVCSTSTKQLCPSCKATKEIAQHFLTCPHPDQQMVQKDMHQLLLKQLVKNNISATLHDLLAFGLCTGWQEPTQIQLELNNGTHHLYTAQLQLSWNQLH